MPKTAIYLVNPRIPYQNGISSVVYEQTFISSSEYGFVLSYDSLLIGLISCLLFILATLTIYILSSKNNRNDNDQGDESEDILETESSNLNDDNNEIPFRYPSESSLDGEVSLNLTSSKEPSTKEIESLAQEVIRESLNNEVSDSDSVSNISSSDESLPVLDTSSEGSSSSIEVIEKSDYFE